MDIVIEPQGWCGDEVKKGFRAEQQALAGVLFNLCIRLLPSTQPPAELPASRTLPTYQHHACTCIALKPVSQNSVIELASKPQPSPCRMSGWLPRLAFPPPSPNEVNLYTLCENEGEKARDQSGFLKCVPIACPLLSSSSAPRLTPSSTALALLPLPLSLRMGRHPRALLRPRLPSLFRP